MKNIILILFNVILSMSAFGQASIITGKVTDASDGSPMLGVNVIIKNKAGDMTGSMTGKDGRYTISNKGGVTITFSYLGMETFTQNIGTRNVIDVQLKSSSVVVEDVVVTALGLTRDAKSLNYARQSVETESLNEARTPDFVSSLSGKVAGLMVTPPGQNTGSSSIIIRGSSSATADNNAIFVVDGVIMENGAVGGEGSGLDRGNAMGDINPSDIASMEVLKGPNATALYGSRASNGVIMITTKKAATTGIKVTASNNTMFQRISQYPEYQNTFGVGMDLDIQASNIMTTPNPITGSRYRSWGPMMLGQPYIAIDGQERPYLPQPNNIKDFYQTSTLMTNTVTVEGGTQTSSMRLTYTNYSANSVVDGVNKNVKHTFNLNATNKFTKWLDLSSRITFIRDDVKNRQYTNSNNRNPVNTYVHMARSTSLDELRQYKDEFGNETSTNRNTSNPYWIINENPTTDTRDRLQGAFNMTIKLPWNIKLMGRAGIDMFWFKGTAFQNMGGFYDPIGRVEEFTEFFASTTLEGTAVWNKKIGKFSLNAMAGTSTNTRSGDKRTQTVIGLVQPSFIHISNSTDKITPMQDIYKRMTNSVYGSLSVGYKDMLYLDGTVRNDWSSTLPIANCSYFYPSVGTSFIFSELFNSRLGRIISLGKLRLSYAKVGNDTGPYKIANNFLLGSIYSGSPYAVVSSTMNNPYLKPEITHSYEAGLDMSFLNNLVGFDLTYYSASTFNQIVPAFIPPTSGYEKRMFNTGEIRNSGIEFSLRAKPITKKDFKWSTNVNFSKNYSKVVSLLDDYNLTSMTLYSASNTSVNVEVGQPYGYIRGVGVLRNDRGQMVMVDGDSPGEFEQVPNMGFGSSSPDWLLGYSNDFSYKGISLSFLLDVRYGGIMYSNTYSKMMTNGMTTENYDGRIGYALSKHIYNEDDTEMTHGITWGNAVQRVYNDNGDVIGYKPVNKFFSPSGYEYTRSSVNEFSVFDATYVKLREIAVSYSIPSKILKKTLFSSIKVSFVSRNPWIIYQKTPRGIDPESAATTGNGRGIENGSLPPITTFGFNISISTK